MKNQVKRLSISQLKTKISSNNNVTKATAGAFGKGHGNGEIPRIII